MSDQTELGRNRPRMWQTYAPFVEFYVGPVDILRSASGKPRTLISFTHDMYAGTGGFWTLEVFDPAYIAMEELLVATGVKDTEVADQAYEDTEGGDTDGERTNIATASFRYGYVGHSADQVERSVSVSGEEFFYGTIHAFVPSYQTNGTLLTIRGDSAGTRIKAVPQEYTNYDGLTLFEIVQAVCKERKWTLVPYASDKEEEQVHTLANIPVNLKKTDEGHSGTEEKSKPMRQRENEDPLNFLNRLCAYARPTLPDGGNNFTCRLEYRIPGTIVDGKFAKTGEPKGYLEFGLETFEQEKVVRSYTYMRDPRSDVISFQPNVQVWTAQLSGASGMVYKYDDMRLGEMGYYTLTEVSRSMKMNLETRSPISFNLPEWAAFQKGVAELPEGKDKQEGKGTGSSRAAPEIAPDSDAPSMSMTTALNSEQDADHQTMNYYLAMQNFVTRATMSIFGDPSPDVIPGKVIAVWVFVPDVLNNIEDQMRIHWTSSVWLITGVNHEIRAGEMTTNLELTRQGWNRGGVTTNVAYEDLLKKLGEGGQRRIGGGGFSGG